MDHMLPPAFPLLLIFPAVAIDVLEWLWNRRGAAAGQERPRPRWWRDWLFALILASVFLAIVLAVQWPFSTFLLSDAADNRFFARSGHWPYFATPGDWMNSFWDLSKDPVTPRSIVLAFCRAFISFRIGLWLANYLRRLKR
jgi:hypothetical protein